MKEAILAKMAELRQVGAEDAALAFAAERSMEMVQAYCNLEEMPAELEHVCVCMGLEIHDKGGLQEGGIKEITEGKVSVTFADEADTAGAFLQHYQEELNRVRKMQWGERGEDHGRKLAGSEKGCGKSFYGQMPCDGIYRGRNVLGGNLFQRCAGKRSDLQAGGRRRRQ